MSLRQLQQAFTSALGLGPDADLSALRAGEAPQWDSLGHMELVAEIERTFGIQLSNEDILSLDSFATAVRILSRRGITVTA